ncbi:MAG: methionine--tRNA ligase [Fidelibacterota bacterium]
MTKFYITTPIYYVNDEPHLGHAYTTILADVLARYHREAGEEVFFLTGTDEHGQKVFQAARKRGVSPKEHCDEMVVRFKGLWEKLHIRYDHFIRTTDPDHQEVVRTVLQRIHDGGDIYFDEYSGRYCVGCERFYTDKELVDGKCPQHRRKLEVITEKNYFFKMSRYQDRLVQYIRDHPGFIQPEFRRNEVLGFLRQPLEDLCISRPKSRLPWGIELPFDPDYVTYVWFDALLNYVSAVGATRDDERFRKWWPADTHLIGKDILTTHAVYWPTFLFAAGLPLPHAMFAHGWWLSEDFKMSKSLGNVVKPLDLIEECGVDSVRYFLMRDMVLGQDSSFSLEGFARRYNSDLANDLGNLVGRVVTLIRRHFDGRIPVPGSPGETETGLRAYGERIPGKVMEKIAAMRVNEAVEETLQFVRAINRYMEKSEPWKLVTSQKDRAGTVLYFACESLRIALELLHPIMPEKVEKILTTIGALDPGERYRGNLADGSWGRLLSERELGTFEVPFPRIELQSAVRRPAEEEGKMPEGIITIEEFQKIRLRTARITEAEKVKGADTLLALHIDLGDESRQIVAGIAPHYDPGELVGKVIVVVTNLKPVTIRGVESNGMLLAATGDGSVVLVTVDDPSVGAGVPIS